MPGPDSGTGKSESVQDSNNDVTAPKPARSPPPVVIKEEKRPWGVVPEVDSEEFRSHVSRKSCRF